MTDKELRKLSRLELLELLLNEGRENKKLQEELEKLKSENNIEKTTERLKETAEQFDLSLQNAEVLVSVMQKLIAGEDVNVPVNDNSTVSRDADTENNPKQKTVSHDADIYRRLMHFFLRNMNYLSYLPDDLREDITARLTEILAKVKENETDKD